MASELPDETDPCTKIFVSKADCDELPPATVHGRFSIYNQLATGIDAVF